MIEVRAIHILDALDTVACLAIAEFPGRGALLVRITASNALVCDTSMGLRTVPVCNALHAIGKVPVADAAVGTIEGVDAASDLFALALIADCIFAAICADHTFRALSQDRIAHRFGGIGAIP
jgi:hypothetical protein